MSTQETKPDHEKITPPQKPLSDPPPAIPKESAAEASPKHAPPPKRPLKWIIAAVVLLLALIIGIPKILKSLSTVSTDDAYVNGHVTFVAPRVAGQVAKVLVDDNNRVHKGDLLVQIDREPFLVQEAIAQSAVSAAETDLTAARATARAQVAQTRSLRFALEHAIEEVDDQVALLQSRVTALKTDRAALDKAQGDYDRALIAAKSGVASKDEMDLRKESLLIAQARLEEAIQGIYQIRVGLGLPAKPEKSDDLTEVPPNLNQTFSTVAQAQASLIQAAAQIGYVDSLTKSPRQMVADFYKQDPNGDIDKIYARLQAEAPIVKQSEAKLLQAQRQLDQAKLNTKYCDVIAEIDGVVTRRNVNPGNNIIVGQDLMAIRSLTEIWVDANFKETQLADLRIGQSVDIEADMYGRKQIFKGRISGFTEGTGSTLALLPAQNATGNYVKVVQRLPVRIDLIDYNPDKIPLFIGLSVEPTVNINESPTGPNAGSFLQPYATTAPATSPATSPETRP